MFEIFIIYLGESHFEGWDKIYLEIETLKHWKCNICIVYFQNIKVFTYFLKAISLKTVEKFAFVPLLNIRTGSGKLNLNI